MKRILFPTDFSDAANNALDIAMSLAKKSKAELHILHSLNSAQQYVDISLSSAGDITMPGMQPEIVMEAIAREKKRVTALMKTTVKKVEAFGVHAESEIFTQSLDSEINDYIQDKFIDFVVMGTRGASGLREAFIGSVAQKVVRVSTVPVLTVSEEFKDFKIKNMVCSSDFLEEKINMQLPRIQKFADSFKANLHLVCVNTPTYFEESVVVEDRMKKVVDNFKLKPASLSIYNAFDIDEGIIAFAEQKNADVIAMVTHGYRGMKKLFNDNVTESVVNHSKIPVLTLHIH
jgi:nucleotide-binding universal stress UspA family protein